MFRRLWRSTIWAKDAIPIQDWKFRSMKRVWLPIIDLLYIAGGFSAARYGVPAINEFFPDGVVDAFGYSLALFAFFALIGVSFVKLWWLEIVAKCVIFGQIITYVTALVILTRAGDDARGFVFVIALLATTPILIRLSIVSSEWAERRAKEGS